MLTRLGGQPMAVNPDLMEKAEATPDTVVTLVDGHKFVVAESVDVVVDRVRAWRAAVAAEAFAMSVPAAPDEFLGDHGDRGRASSMAAHPSAHPACQSAGHPADHALDGPGGSALARVLQMPAREE